MEDDDMKVEGTQIEIHEEGKKTLFKGSKKQQLQQEMKQKYQQKKDQLVFKLADPLVSDEEK